MTQIQSTLRALSIVALALVRSLTRHARRALGPRATRIRVGVDIRPFYEPLTGVGWYLAHLLDELAKRDDLELVAFGDARITDIGPALHHPLPQNMRHVTFDLRGTGYSPIARKISAAAYVVLVYLEGCDLIFGANYFLPRLMGAVARRRVITIHDLTYRRHPELLQRETLANLEHEMAREIFRADGIITVSHSTRRDLLEFYGVADEKVFPIHSGVAGPAEADQARDDGSSTKTLLPARYLLFVSTIEPRKDLDTLLDAFERLRDNGAYHGDLVVVGKVGWKAEATMARIDRGRWSKAIHHLDYLDPRALESVYRSAEIFIFPSLYEGFGFPLLEAMSLGVPTISSRSSSLPEVGGEATLYFEPGDSGELARQIVALAGSCDARERLVRAGLERVATFTWQRAAEQTATLFRRVASS